MINRILVVFLLSLWSIPLVADDVLVRTKIAPEDSVATGERVVLKVDVLGKDSWARLPSIPTIEVSGAITYVPPSQSVRLSETIDGESYTGQRYEWWVYPRRSGELTIPAIDLSIEQKVFGSDSDPSLIGKKSKELKLDVTLPEGAGGKEELLVTSSLKTNQQWSGQPERLMVGDGVTRTITRTAAGVPSLMIPPLEFDDADGVRLYVKEPKTENRINRGELSSTRTDTVTYVFEEPGAYELPELTVTSFDAGSNTTRTETLRGFSLTVQPSVSKIEVPVDPASSVARSNAGYQMAAGLLIVAAAVLLLIWRRHSLIARWNRFRNAQRNSEPYRFRSFCVAARSADAAVTLRELTKWSDSIQAEQLVPRLDQFVLKYGKPADFALLSELQSAVDHGTTDWNHDGLLDACRSMRKNFLRSTRQKTNEIQTALPELRQVKSDR